MVVKQLIHTEENGYRDVLKEVYLSKHNIIILDCSKDVIGEVLTQAQQIGMVSEGKISKISNTSEEFRNKTENFSVY